MADVSVIVTSSNTSSERRISYNWSLSHLKARLEQITGIPASAQLLQLYVAEADTPTLLVAPAGVSEDDVTVDQFRVVRYSRLNVEDTRPPGMQENYSDVSGVEKFELTPEEYARRTDTVLAWKKRNRLGRFADKEKEDAPRDSEIVAAAGIEVGKRCMVSDPFERRGVVRFVGPVAELPGDGLVWVGIEFDEPVGKNDGCIKGKRYFDARPKHGSFVRPEKVDVGDFPEINEFSDDDEI